MEVYVGLPKHLTAAAAELYEEAFEQKLAPIVPSKSIRIALLQSGMHRHLAIVATEDGALLGVAGFHDGTQSFTGGISSHELVRRLGWIKGIRAILLFALLERKPAAKELLLDGIAVHTSARGRGVGTRLLTALCKHSQQNGYTTIRLDVVDTNPRARALYERNGFVPTRTEQHPYLRTLFGFSASTTMIKTTH